MIVGYLDIWGKARVLACASTGPLVGAVAGGGVKARRIDEGIGGV